MSAAPARCRRPRRCRRRSLPGADLADRLRHIGLVLDNQHPHAPTLTTCHISPAYRKPHTCWQRHAAFTQGMNHTAPARAGARRASRLVLGGLAVVVAAFVGTLGLPSVSSSTPSFGDVLRGDDQGPLGEADGVLTDGASVFDDETPAVANLDPSLLEALRRAANMQPRTASSSRSTAGGVHPTTRSSCCTRPSGSTARKRRLPGGWRLRRRLPTCRGTRSTSGRSMPRSGCPTHGFRVRAVPGQRQRTLALPAAPRGRR